MHKEPVNSRRAVLITGCSSGIGLEAAQTLKERGYRLFATARNMSDVAHLMEQGFEALALDLNDTESIEQALETVLCRTQGKLYGLINNGAYGQPGALEDLSRQALAEQFETNVIGTHDLTRRVIPIMRRAQEGRIIQISSVLGFVAMRYRGAYVASKYALEGLSDALRLELKGSGIQISLIEPGPITSAFRANALAAFKRHVDADASVHREQYAQIIEESFGERPEGESGHFTLPPRAVVKEVIRALESSRARTRYHITTPTVIFALLKRILPDRWLDNLLIKG